jgi:hypothetical protein
MASATANPPASPAAEETRARAAGLREVVVEFGDGNNRNMLWPPTQDRLRGWWDRTRLPPGETSEHGLFKMPNIPGIHIRLNPRDRVATIFDPLEDDKDLCAKVSDTHKLLFGRPCTFVPRSTHRLRSDDKLATWLYWLIRMHAAGHCAVREGKLPTLEELAAALPKARVRRNFFDSTAYRNKAETDVERIAADEADYLRDVDDDRPEAAVRQRP